MSAVWTVAAREIRSRRMVLAAALVVATLPFAARVLGRDRGPDLQELIALLLCTSFSFAIALGVGASMVSRELGERRLGFYFSRPIPALHLWAGKLLGAATVVLVAFACMQVAILASLPDRHLPRGADDIAGYFRVLGAGMLLLLFVMAVGNVVTSMYRARSPWFVVDIVLAAASVTAFVIMVRTIVEAGAIFALIRHPHEPDGARAIEFVLVAFVVALLGAAAAQLTAGRSDARRAHAALSVTVWVSSLLILGGFAAWQRWLLAGTPAQAGGAGYPLVASPAGEGLFFRGLTGRVGFRPFFLMDAASGGFLRISPESDVLPTFSLDGRTAAWVSIPLPWEEDHRPRLSVVRLGDGVRLAARTPMEEATPWHTVLAVHPDGRQAVIAGFGAAGLVDLDTARVAPSIAQPQVVAADVLPDGRVRLFSHTLGGAVGAALVVAVWSPSDGSLAETLRVPRGALLTRRGGIAVVAVGLREKAILDLATGTEHRVASVDADTLPRALVLANGRLALSMGAEVRITDAAGATVAVVPLPTKSQAIALREPEPGQLAVGVWSLVLSKRGTLFVDAGTGAVLREEPGLLPAGAQSEAWPQAVPGSLASRLFTNEDGALLALGPGDRRRVIVAAAGGRE